MIRIFDLGGRLKKEFFGYNQLTREGLTIHTGDINNDQRDEIITTPLRGGGGDMSVFSGDGELLNQFIAYPFDRTQSASFAVGDLTADGMAEIITAPAQYGDTLKVFSPHGVDRKSVV